MAFAAARMIMPKDKSRKTSDDLLNNSLQKSKAMEGTSTHSFNSRCVQGRADMKPQNSRGHVKHYKGGKGKKNKKNKRDMYDIIVNIDLNKWQLTDEEVAEFKEVFMLFDKDEDGILTFSELNIVMKSLGQRPKEEELLKMVRDVSEDPIYDTIEFNEFLQMMSKQQKKSVNEDSIKEAFKIFDKDDDGYISVEELRNIMQSLGEKMVQPELDEMIQAADSDHDGLINYKEFVQLLCTESKAASYGAASSRDKKRERSSRGKRSSSNNNKENNSRGTPKRSSKHCSLLQSLTQGQQQGQHSLVGRMLGETASSVLLQSVLDISNNNNNNKHNNNNNNNTNVGNKAKARSAEEKSSGTKETPKRGGERGRKGVSG